MKHGCLGWYRAYQNTQWPAMEVEGRLVLTRLQRRVITCRKGSLQNWELFFDTQYHFEMMEGKGESLRLLQNFRMRAESNTVNEGR